MTYRGKMLAGFCIFILGASWLAPVWAQSQKTPNYDPASNLPPYDSKPGTGTVLAEFSTDSSPNITAITSSKAYVDDPSGQMVNSLQRENNPNYPFPTAKPANSKNEVLPIFPGNPDMPGQAKTARRANVPADERLPGGTTNVIPSDDMLSNNSEFPVDEIEYQTGGYNPGPMVRENPFAFNESYTWQVLPGSILYKSYLASNHESRFGSQMGHINNLGNVWDTTLGGRAGILRYGTADPYWPEGYQLDIEGAAFPRLNLDHDRDLDSVDFRVGIPLTMRRGAWQTKFGYYHLSSHRGDENMVRNNSLNRINYVRESLMFGVGLFLNPNFRLYTEVDYAFHVDGGAKPWEFQFGAEYSPIDCDRYIGSPFVAVHGHLHEEVDFGGSVTAQIGWQWRGRMGHLVRTGFQYFNGMSEQAQFFNQFEQSYSWGVWYDF